MLAFNRTLLSKRYVIETINYQLKNILQVEYSRPGFMVNVILGVVAYYLKNRNRVLSYLQVNLN